MLDVTLQMLMVIKCLAINLQNASEYKKFSPLFLQLKNVFVSVTNSTFFTICCLTMKIGGAARPLFLLLSQKVKNVPSRNVGGVDFHYYTKSSLFDLVRF